MFGGAGDLKSKEASADFATGASPIAEGLESCEGSASEETMFRSLSVRAISCFGCHGANHNRHTSAMRAAAIATHFEVSRFWESGVGPTAIEDSAKSEGSGVPVESRADMISPPAIGTCNIPLILSASASTCCSAGTLNPSSQRTSPR